MVNATTQEVMFLCPDKNVPVKMGLPSMTPQQFIHWRENNTGIATWVNCTACARRHLVLGADCFLEGEELQA
jgi:hypothetical protein